MHFSHVLIGGVVGSPPQPRESGEGSRMCSFVVGIGKASRDRSGKVTTKTLWVKVHTWGRNVEWCGAYLKKGSGILIRGELSERKWKDADGKARTDLEILAEKIEIDDAA